MFGGNYGGEKWPDKKDVVEDDDEYTYYCSIPECNGKIELEFEHSPDDQIWAECPDCDDDRFMFLGD